ncbi:hypothetical protein [Cupriavidus sp. D39]|uniref:hypothetical protein n=1 Tax=Cupriavidus sp. D39 TaxID=2997877 RepID=UPI0022708638|nr:hypothetical protein [Cupriavidus sp. D39]MCY0858746.1 hypothetical protein [Cupriavidus sp. D39]
MILSDSLPSDTTVENQVAALWRHCVRWSAMRYVSPSRKHWQMALPFLVASVQGSARNPTDQARVDLIAGLLLGAIDTHRMRRRHIMNVDMQTERLIFQRLGARANRKQSVVSAAGYRAFDSDQYLGIELDVGEHDSFDPTALIQSLPKEVVRDPNDWDRDTRSVPLPAEARLVLSYSDFGCLLSDNPRAQNPTTPGTADFGLEVFFAHGCRMLIDAELQVHRGTFDPRLKGYQCAIRHEKTGADDGMVKLQSDLQSMALWPGQLLGFRQISFMGGQLYIGEATAIRRANDKTYVDYRLIGLGRLVLLKPMAPSTIRLPYWGILVDTRSGPLKHTPEDFAIVIPKGAAKGLAAVEIPDRGECFSCQCVMERDDAEYDIVACSPLPLSGAISNREPDSAILAPPREYHN